MTFSKCYLNMIQENLGLTIQHVTYARRKDTGQKAARNKKYDVNEVTSTKLK